MGKTSNALMIALAVFALFWGNCLSCPQMLTAMASGHSCCPKTHQTTVKCQSQGLQHFVKADMQAPVALTATRLTLDPQMHTWTSEPELIVSTPLGSSTPPPTLRL